MNLDSTINVTILILTFVVMIIPLFKELKYSPKTNKKGRLINGGKRGLTLSGKWFIFSCCLAIGIGVWKVVRDDQSQTQTESRQNDLISEADTMKIQLIRQKELTVAQFNQDSIYYVNTIKTINKQITQLQIELAKNGLQLTKDFHVQQINNVVNNKNIQFIKIDHSVGTKFNDTKFVLN